MLYEIARILSFLEGPREPSPYILLKNRHLSFSISKSSFNLTYGVLLSCAMWQSMATMREAHVLVAIMPSKDINASGCKVATLGEQLLS